MYRACNVAACNVFKYHTRMYRACAYAYMYLIETENNQITFFREMMN